MDGLDAFGIGFLYHNEKRIAEELRPPMVSFGGLSVGYLEGHV